MTDTEIKVLKEVYGLSHFDDLDQLRAAIREKDTQMSTLQKVEITMRIGNKIQEALAAASLGDGYTLPPRKYLLFTALVLGGLSAGFGIWAVKAHGWIILRVAAGLVAFIFFAGAGRAVFRFVKKGDS